MSQANTTSAAKSIKQLYDEGMAEVFRVVGSLESTPEQRKMAKATAEDLTSMLVKHTLASIDGRTALLAGLIIELNQVIDAVESKPPYLDAVANFTGIVARAQALFDEEKKTLS